MGAHAVQHRQRKVYRQRQRLGVARLQIADAIAGGAADVGHALRRELHVVETLGHAGAHFAGKDGGLVVGRRCIR